MKEFMFPGICCSGAMRNGVDLLQKCDKVKMLGTQLCPVALGLNRSSANQYNQK